MAYYNPTFKLVNNTDYEMVLDPNGCSGLDFGVWPKTIAPHTTVPNFNQTGNFQIKLTALYILQSGSTAQNIYIQFYMSSFGVGTVSQSMTFSPGPFIAGSAICEDFSNGQHCVTTPVNNELHQKVVAITNTVGTAEFKIG